MSAQPADGRAPGTRAADAAAPLDLLLADAALGPARRLLPGGAAVRFATSLARRPHRVAHRATLLAGELARIGLGRSTLAAPATDRRFTDPAWTSNPLLRRLVQTYLAAAQTTEQLLADADLEWRDATRLRLLADNLELALAPSNLPLTSPVFRNALIDSGGGSVVRGARQLAADLATPPRVPSTVTADAFEVGADLAVSRGAVVLRTPMFELLHYQPQTPRVRRVPLLVVPPTINKYYIIDLAAGRSLVEYLVGSGQQVFVISWRNPDARHHNWGADTYGEAILEALEAIRRICRVDRSLLLGLCSGGILTAMALAHLTATGQRDRIAGFGLAVAVLDQTRAGTTAAALDEGTARAAAAASAARGYLDGRALAEVFAWLRPGDLVWHYWVNNYLAGRPPPPFDILYWNADTTRMPARLHRDFLRLTADNALTRLGGRARFVLSSGGRIASMVNPPGNGKASFRTAVRTPPDPAAWLDQSTTEPGSWWPDYLAWLEQRGGGQKARPRRLGSVDFPPLDPAPGTYVLDH